MSYLRFALAGFCLALPSSAAAQGLPFHTPSALTTAFEERGFRSFTWFQSRGDVSTLAMPLVLLPYAPSQRVTTTVSTSLVRKRLDGGATGAGASFDNTGLGDVRVSAKWAFFVRDRFAGTSRLAVSVAGSLPTGGTDARLPDGELAPRPVQLGPGSASVFARLVGTWIRDRWGFTSSAGGAWRGTDGDFAWGNVGLYDVAIGYRFPAEVETIKTRTVQVYLEANGSVSERSRKDGTAVDASGAHVLYLSPGVQWVVAPNVLVEAGVQVPVIQSFNGAQPRFGSRPAVGFRYLFF